MAYNGNNSDSRCQNPKNKTLNNSKKVNMKYLKSRLPIAIICYLLLSTVVSCEEHTRQTVPYKQTQYKNPYGNTITEFQYDGCEYLHSVSGYKGFLSHKGNCKNPIHDCR